MAKPGIEYAFRKRLVDAVGAIVGTRVRPQQLSQQELELGPGVIYVVRGDSKLGRSLDDESADELGRAVIQVDCLGQIGADDSYAALRDMKGLIDDAFDADTAAGDWAYADSGGAVRTLHVQHCRVEDNADDITPPVAAQELGIPAVSCLVIVIYEHP